MRLDRHNTWTDIHGAPPWFLKYVARHLSVQVELGTKKGARFGLLWKHQGMLYGSLLHNNRVPAGLTPHLTQLVQHYNLHAEIHDHRVPPLRLSPPMDLVNMNWRPYQNRVQAALLAHPTGVIDASPRSGKTAMAARIIDTLNLPTVCLAPSVQIVRQTYEKYLGFFGSDLVARLDGSAKPHERDSSKHIVVTTHQSALALPQEWWDTRKVLVIDEFHHAAADSYHRISHLARFAYYRYGFTGTHFRTGDDHLSMEAISSNSLYKVNVSNLVEQGYLASPRVVFFPVRGKVKARDWKVAYARGIVASAERNKLVVGLANQLVELGYPTIVLTRHRKHADELGSRIDGAAVVKGGENALTSRVVKEFADGQHPCLVGTTVIGEGVDIPRASALVFASGGRPGVGQIQSYFRPLTASPGKHEGLIYDFFDVTHTTLRRHAAQRYLKAQQIFGAENCSIQER